jgi:polyphosphate kinase
VAAASAQTETRFLNRELSHLDFNARLLEVAADETVPLLDRVNFCSIFSANMDEFFMVRVAGLTDQIAAGVTRRSPDGLTPRAALAEVRRRSLQLAYDQAKLLRRTLTPALAAEGIVVAGDRGPRAGGAPGARTRLRERRLPGADAARRRARAAVPVHLGTALSLGLFVRDEETGEERFARVKVPELLPRFLALDRPELKEEPWVAVVPTRFASDDGDTLFAEIGRSPVLVHHPYDSFARTFEAFVRTSATDPRTVAV